jgi:hypothetical protein
MIYIIIMLNFLCSAEEYSCTIMCYALWGEISIQGTMNFNIKLRNVQNGCGITETEYKIMAERSFLKIFLWNKFKYNYNINTITTLTFRGPCLNADILLPSFGFYDTFKCKKCRIQ